MEKDGKITRYDPLMEEREKNSNLLRHKDKCDKYDYLAAACCGVIGGLVDVFFVGAPGESQLANWTDAQIDNMVKGFAKAIGWNPRENQQNNVASAIGFLEKRFKVNYDQRYSPDVSGLFNMSTKNHHIKSLSHSPDIVGLFFSILNQFTSTSSFVSDGKVITVVTDSFELQGSNFIAKLFCGTVNWFGHIMSDIAGSSGSAGNKGRGTGVVIPFYELFQFCTFGKFSVGKDRQDLATIAVRAFQEGYDFRFGLAMSIPVIVTDLFIRLIWSLRQYFQYGKAIRDCIPTSQHDNLRVMLLFGNGALCLVDGIDASIRSGGNFLAFFMRLNLIGWFRFASLVLKEVCIRIGLLETFQTEVEAYKRISQGITSYLEEIKKLDTERYEREVNEYTNVMSSLLCAKTEQELNAILLDSFDKLGLRRPWQGDFDEFMKDPDNRLEFK